jgi:mRNA-degrading endonuclease RelE of RelBE toxin-antitoxin system
MMRQIHPEALQEYDEAAAWYEEQRDGLGGEFSDAVVAAIAVIMSDPGRFQPVAEDLRVFRLKRFRYHLIYPWDQEAGSIFITALAHQRRRPGYWRGRV